MNTLNHSYLNNFDEIIQKYNYFIFDCDGVIWKEQKIFTGCVSTIKKIISLNKNVYFLTNINRLSRCDIKEKFRKLCDLDIDVNLIYSAGFITAKYIKEQFPHVNHIYLIGREGLETELNDLGIKVDRKFENVLDYSIESLEEVEIDDSIQACVCGFDEKINYFKIFYACNIIKRTGLFFGTNRDKIDCIKDLYLPAGYTFINTLEVCTEKKAEIITKPDKRSLEIIMNHHNIPHEEKDKIVMIGDSVTSDIKFANDSSIDSILVFTGITKEEDYIISLSNLEIKPTYLLKSFDQ